MGDTEGRTESREEGERDSAPQLSDQHLFYPFLTLGFPHTSYAGEGQQTLQLPCSVGKEGGTGKWVVASRIVAKDRLSSSWRYVTTTRNTQGRMSEVCPYQRPGSSDILLLSSQIYKKGCKAWESGSQKGRTTFP